MRTHLITVLSVLGISFSGIAACTDVDDDIDEAELVDGSDDSKSDQADIALTPIEFAPPKHAWVMKAGVIKSSAAWKQRFGVVAPSSIDFEKEWVAYYTAGEQSSGGYRAEITRVRLSETGKSLKISTRLEAPGPECFVTFVLTAPYAIVKFAKPSPAPTTNRYFNETHVYACDDDDECANGTVVTEQAYTPVGESYEVCAIPDGHCVTNDYNACPQIQPLPPTFCPDGTVVPGAPSYVASADGMECSLPSVHCVTNDQTACPAIHPLPPSYCMNGTIETEPAFVPSADGMECQIPRVHCVIDDAGVCPQF